jgi:hypothetical protein
MSKKKPDIWVVLIIVIGFGVFVTTRAENAAPEISPGSQLIISPTR